ncbi:MAG: hypothetical protein Q9218_003992 [Villophora microphyllina]
MKEQEPPKVRARLAPLGHIFGFYRYGHRYINILRKPLPIYTLEIFSQKFYVVNDPDLIIRVQRYSKLFSFSHIIVATTRMFCGVDEQTMVKVQDGIADPQHGYLNSIRTTVRSALVPGTDLDDLCNAMLNRLNDVISGLDLASSDDSQDLWRLACHITTSASTKAAYGPQNPFDLDPSLTDSFWAFKGNIMAFMINVLPGLFAPEAYKGREKLINALQYYFHVGGAARASAFIKARYDTNKEHGMLTVESAHLELGNLIGLLGNTAPTLFWLLMQIYSDAALLDSLRGEVEGIITVETAPSTHRTDIRLAVDNIRISCPLLVSAYKEVLRLRSRSMSSRVVLEDTFIDGYLLRKGAFVQMPSYIPHSDIDLWGHDAGEYRPRRFMKVDNNPSRGDNHHTRSGAFRAFGGGQSLCSGRHFATLEVVAVAAMFVAKYDLCMQAGSWNPKAEPSSQSLATSFEMPGGKVRVKIARRAGYHPDARWEIVTPVSKVNFSFP